MDYLKIGTTYGERYHVLDQLDKGGQGIPYVVNDLKWKQVMVAKLVLVDFTSGRVITPQNWEKLDEHMRQETLASIVTHIRTELLGSEVRSPYVVQLYGLETEAFIPDTELFDPPLALPALLMEYLENAKTLSFLTGLKQYERITVLAKVADGLAAIHEAGLVHRDLTPHNVLAIKNKGVWTPKIIDFGIARPIEHYTRVAGKLAYLSPFAQDERGGQIVGPAIDIWGLATMIVHQLTGHMPFDLKIPKNKLDLEFLKNWRNHVENTAPALNGLDDNAELTKILNSCFIDNTEDLPTATEVAKALHKEADRLKPQKDTLDLRNIKGSTATSDPVASTSKLKIPPEKDQVSSVSSSPKSTTTNSDNDRPPTQQLHGKPDTLKIKKTAKPQQDARNKPLPSVPNETPSNPPKPESHKISAAWKYVVDVVSKSAIGAGLGSQLMDGMKEIANRLLSSEPEPPREVDIDNTLKNIDLIHARLRARVDRVQAEARVLVKKALRKRRESDRQMLLEDARAAQQEAKPLQRILLRLNRLERVTRQIRDSLRNQTLALQIENILEELPKNVMNGGILHTANQLEDAMQWQQDFRESNDPALMSSDSLIAEIEEASGHRPTVAEIAQNLPRRTRPSEESRLIENILRQL